MALRLRGGRVLGTDGAVASADLWIQNGHILAEDGAPGETWTIDGLLVLPGIVDLHGDAFERQLMPRPKVQFSVDLALLETDRQLIANGITTAYHGLTYSWEPGLRGREAARGFLAALARRRGDLLCDTKVHLRFETHNIDAAPEVEGWLRSDMIDLLAFNDHVPHLLEKAANPHGLAAYAERAHLTLAAFLDLFHEVRGRAPEIPVVIERLARAAQAHGVPMASHDDETPAMRQEFRALGVGLCEFPVDRRTAEAARQAGDHILLGAPNILRGGSHCGRLNAAEMVAAGLCDVLTSDYFYPALLQAAFLLARDGVVPLAHAWALISTLPAQAVGLADRGVLAPGRRADVVLVDDSDPALPRVVATFVAGRLVYSAGDGLRRCA